jgi:ATP-binding cassette, subfamily A (ABC1), member 3
MLLDEPSSSMDSASQRLLWNILRSIAPGRSLLLTSHSMLEVDALAHRAGIISKKMLAIGTTDYLREKHGNHYHVQIVLKSSPHTTEEEMESVKSWILEHFPGAEVENKSFHGQTKFKVPAVMHFSDEKYVAVEEDEIGSTSTSDNSGATNRNNTINVLFGMLEENKDKLGIDFYSISRTSMDEVFLNIVGNANVLEEGYEEEILEKEVGSKNRGLWRRKRIS